jgi:hypothetical protein
MMKKTIAVLVLFRAALLPAETPASFSHDAGLDSVYGAVLNQLKKDGAEIESASKDAGIKTTVVVSGHYRQTGSYLTVTFVVDSPSQTTVRVAAFEERRYKALKTEPWSTPKVNAEQSAAAGISARQTKFGRTPYRTKTMPSSTAPWVGSWRAWSGSVGGRCSTLSRQNIIRNMCGVRLAVNSMECCRAGRLT